jgi:hypothetical protein
VPFFVVLARVDAARFLCFRFMCASLGRLFGRGLCGAAQ